MISEQEFYEFVYDAYKYMRNNGKPVIMSTRKEKGNSMYYTIQSNDEVGLMFIGSHYRDAGPGPNMRQIPIIKIAPVDLQNNTAFSAQVHEYHPESLDDLYNQINNDKSF